MIIDAFKFRDLKLQVCSLLVLGALQDLLHARFPGLKLTTD
uniref:Uncharacterized protein n=1 Tax=Anguilla anguilla TaxID=7936 RepID=A0A0E9Y2P5_ANGAN